MQRDRACAKDTLLIWGCAGLPILALGSDLAAFPPEGPPQTIDLTPTVRDVRRDHPDFHASPFGGSDHSAGNIAVGSSRPTHARRRRLGSRLAVARRREPAHHPTTFPPQGGGEHTALHPTWSLKAASAAATQEAIGGSFVAKESDPWQAHMQLAASGNGAAPA